MDAGIEPQDRCSITVRCSVRLICLLIFAGLLGFADPYNSVEYPGTSILFKFGRRWYPVSDPQHFLAPTYMSNERKCDAHFVCCYSPFVR
jgi:hypothetical protein